MRSCKWLKPAYPDDHIIIVTQFSIAGTFHYQPSLQTLRWMTGVTLKLVHNPRNKYDRNAIAVFAVGKLLWTVPRIVHVGHLPADLAQQIADLRCLPSILPRLRLVDIPNSTIIIELTGPKELRQKLFTTRGH